MNLLEQLQAYLHKAAWGVVRIVERHDPPLETAKEPDGFLIWIKDTLAVELASVLAERHRQIHDPVRNYTITDKVKALYQKRREAADKRAKQIEKLRERGITDQQIAARFGISQQRISEIRKQYQKRRKQNSS